MPAGTVTPAGGAVVASSLAGYEYDYVTFTVPVTITATTEGTAQVVVTGSAVVYDGATSVWVEFYAPKAIPGVNAEIFAVLLRDSTVLGQADGGFNQDRNNPQVRYRDTPAAGSHVYSISAFVGATGASSTVNAGVGGSGNLLPGYIRVTRA